MPKGYEDLDWAARQRFHRRAASLNRLADAFGLTFSYDFASEVAQPFVKAHRCLVPRNWNGEP